MNESPHFKNSSFPKELEVKNEFLEQYFERYFKVPYKKRKNRSYVKSESKSNGKKSTLHSQNSPRIKLSCN